MARRQYTDAERAAALAALDANADNVRRTARETGIPHGTLRRWARGEGVTRAGAQLRTQKGADLADLYETHIRGVWGLLETKAKDATYAQIATTIGILTDKMVALRALGRAESDRGAGKVQLTEEERWGRVRELVVRGRTNGAGHATHGDAAAIPSLVAECLTELELGLGAPPAPDEPAGPGDVGPA